MACELGGGLLLHHLLNMRIELLFCVYFVWRFDDHVGFDIEFGEVEAEVLFVAVYALPQAFTYFIL